MQILLTNKFSRISDLTNVSGHGREWRIFMVFLEKNDSRIQRLLFSHLQFRNFANIKQNN